MSTVAANPTKVTQVPDIPEVRQENVLEVVRAIRELLRVREGVAGDALDQNVTYRELISQGQFAVSPVDGKIYVPIPGQPVFIGLPGATDDPEFTPPPAPTHLTVTPGLTTFILSWDAIEYYRHSYTEVWRSGVDDLGQAAKVGNANDVATLYGDPIGLTGAQRFYWIRFVNQAGKPGPFNAIPGTGGTTGLIGSADLTDASVTIQKIKAKRIELQGDVWTDNNPGAGSVAWGAHTLVYDGATKAIGAGNTANKWIYWDSAAPLVYSSSGAFPALTDTQFLVAVNNGGVHDLVWNAAGIATKVIDTALIGDAAVGTAQIQNLAATNAIIGNLAVDSGKLANLSVVTAKIADLNVTTAKFADLSVTTGKFALLSVTTAVIADLNVTTGKFADLSATTAKIADLNVTTGKMADVSVTNAKVATAAIDTANIVNLAVTTGKMADLSATTAKIDDLGVTTAKIAALAVTSAKIGDAEVGTLKIAGNAVTVTAAATGSDGATVTTSVIGGQPVLVIGIIDGADGFSTYGNTRSFSLTIAGSVVKTAIWVNVTDPSGSGQTKRGGGVVTHLYTPGADASVTFAVSAASNGTAGTIIVMQVKR